MYLRSVLHGDHHLSEGAGDQVHGTTHSFHHLALHHTTQCLAVHSVLLWKTHWDHPVGQITIPGYLHAT